MGSNQVAHAAHTKANDKAARQKPILDRVNPDGPMGLGKVAQVLNQEGVPTMSGKMSVEWKVSSTVVPEASFLRPHR